MPLSDIQQYNKILERNTKAMESQNAMSYRWFILVCVVVLIVIMFF